MPGQIGKCMRDTSFAGQGQTESLKIATLEKGGQVRKTLSGIARISNRRTIQYQFKRTAASMLLARCWCNLHNPVESRRACSPGPPEFALEPSDTYLRQMFSTPVTADALIICF
jgi:hypothetical protein